MTWMTAPSRCTLPRHPIMLAAARCAAFRCALLNATRQCASNGGADVRAWSGARGTGQTFLRLCLHRLSIRDYDQRQACLSGGEDVVRAEEADRMRTGPCEVIEPAPTGGMAIPTRKLIITSVAPVLAMAWIVLHGMCRPNGSRNA
jgi:hypothetical protein